MLPLVVHTALLPPTPTPTPHAQLIDTCAPIWIFGHFWTFLDSFGCKLNVSTSCSVVLWASDQREVDMWRPLSCFINRRQKRKWMWKEYLETEDVLQEVEDVDERLLGLGVAWEAVGHRGGLAVGLLQVSDSKPDLWRQGQICVDFYLFFSFFWGC